MTQTIAIQLDHLTRLDVTPVTSIVETLLREGAIATQEQTLSFEIHYPRDPSDPRELSEIPEIRLWFVRLDSVYPWLPFLLDWKGGELARYTAMLVPHQFSRVEGIQYNPEALEIFVMHKLFILADWLKQQEIPAQFRLKSMAQLFGYDIDDTFFNMIQ
ncbi:CRR6 family NdhI maturation factor [Crocosphaera sp. UHCC 0190]|uniref:CRR6 family NdhI maturation factor n=1 Tax=Crocosphaera sp. UHCC 0190 TaxID=3110246 RepID=UPI002B215795|nr:CRR6 family NdhI maturation factor [Crocosphaera sp. UHCC 0190]MEA5511043.1 CRR6 family NdhI maturation factor [Crocosphaera sp. UHCC 0190]